MSIRAANGFMAMMSRQIEKAIINCGNPFVEDYLDSMDCSVEVELAQLRSLQKKIAQQPDTDKSIHATVLHKWLYGWHKADQCLACMGLRSSEKWAESYYAAYRA